MKRPTLEELRQIHPGASEHRGKLWLAEGRVDAILDGVPLNLVRRRYSNCTFTWAEALLGGQWVSLGDPWQSINPPTTQLREAIERRRPPVVYAERNHQ